MYWNLTNKNSCGKLLCAGLFVLAALSAPWRGNSAHSIDEEIAVSFDLEGQEIASDQRIELRLNRDLRNGEGRLAVFVGVTDLTSLFRLEPRSLNYQPTILPLPAGANTLTVYLVRPDDDWKRLVSFQLNVKAPQAENAAKENADPDGDRPAALPEVRPNAEPENETATTESKREGLKMEFTPSLSLNVKSQNQILTFPRESVPERNPFTDLAGQGSVNVKVTNRGWSFVNQFDLAGSSFRQEALRFGELGERAPRIDLSSYLVSIEKGRFKFNMGHVSFGTNRHLISGFSSRGVNVTIPIGKGNEVSLAAMNGTAIVGFDNLIGVSRKKHSVLSATFAREFIKERPNGLRVEFSVTRGSLLPLTSLNQGAVNDAEKSSGFGFRVVGSTKDQRLRFEAGFTRSRFTNPADLQLSEGQTLTEIRPATRNARYAEISFDFIQGLKFWKEKKLKLTGTFRHEEIQPLFRSIAASTQADRRQNQFEVTASFGEINFTYGNLRDNDNLNDIPTILKTLNRRHNVVISIGLNSFFTPAKPKKWLPQLSYTYDHTHQFGAFLPANGDFADPSQVPDQDSFNQSVNAVWQLTKRVGITYAYNRTFQDNKQPGRDLADLASSVNGVSVTTKPFDSLELAFEFGREELKNFEQPRVDRTFKAGTKAVWQTPFLKNSVFSGSLATTLGGDTGNLNGSRNIDFDLEWAYQFSLGTKKLKKMSAQFFIRYSNRYANTIDRQVPVNGFNKTQAFNLGLTFSFF